MSEWVTCEVKGLSELQATLEEMGTKQAKAIVREGLQAGAAEMVKGLAESGSSAPGEVGAALSRKTSWKKSTKMRREELAGTVLIGPKGALPELHVGTGEGKQPKGRKYHRTLNYLIKLLEFGGAGGIYHGSRKPVMTAGFEMSRGAAESAIIAKIKSKLGL